MIVIQRSDGFVLNMTAAKAMNDIPAGLLVEMDGTEYYIVPGYSTTAFIRDGQSSMNVKVIHREWKGWNTDKCGARYEQ